jgi:hypothetical protein
MAIKVSRPEKNQSTPFTTDARGEFENFLLSNGMTADPKKGLVSDGSVGRAYMEVDGKRKLTGWYQLWLNQSSALRALRRLQARSRQPNGSMEAK